MNLGLHVIHNPAGTYSFVGNLPLELATMVPATKSDILGCRASLAADGSYVAPKFPSFKTRADAVAFAESRGCKVAA